MDLRMYHLLHLLLVVKIYSDTACRVHIGVKLCYDKCIKIKGCTLYIFTSHHMACCFGNNTRPPRELKGSVVIKIKQGDLIATQSECQSADRILHTRLKGIICVQERRREQEERKPFVGKRLLMVKRKDNFDNSFFQIRLNMNVLYKEMYLPMKGFRVADLKYNHKSRILYLAYYRENECEIHMFHSHNESTSLYHIPGSFETMALDEERDWILFARRPSDAICKVHRGRRVLLFKTRLLYIRSMAVSSRKQFIYVSTYDAILIFSYTGAEDYFKRISAETPLLMDLTDRYLYFNTQEEPNSCVQQLDTMTNKTTCLVKRVDKATEALAIDFKKMYIKNSYGDLEIYNIATRRIEGQSVDDFDDTYFICLVDF